MAEDDLFNIDVVRDFMSSKGGRVKNHDLVTHFKSYLNDPRCKASNRQKFKVFVNTLAAVKLDEKGEKVLVLKKKYRCDEVSASAPGPSKQEHNPKLPAPKAKLKDSFPVRQPSVNESSSSKEEESLLDSIQKELVKSKVSDIESTTPAPDYVDTSDISQSVPEPKPDYESTDEPPADYEPDGEVEDLQINKDTVKEDTKVDDIQVEVKKEEKTAVDSNVVKNEDKSNTVTEKAVVMDITDTKENVKDTVKQVEPVVDGGGDRDKVSGGEMEAQKATEEQEGRKTPTNETRSSIKAETTSAPVSVKDRAQHLNKISSQSNLQDANTPKKSSKKPDGDGDSMNNMAVNLDPVEREWLIVSAKADYHPMAKLLNTHPNLSKRKDFITTALHWACKHGNIEIVKMLCGGGAMVNARSMSSVHYRDIRLIVTQRNINFGYTPLHLASMHNRESVIEILVEAYGADANLRDFSGKKPKQYLKNSASSRVQQLLQARRSSQSGGFKRTGSYSSKIGTAGHFGIKGSAFMRTSWADTGRHSSSRSPSASPKGHRKSREIDPFLNFGSQERDSQLMPPPNDLPIMRKKRNRKQPTDAFNSLSHQERDNRKSGSDPFLNRSDVMIDKPVHQSSSYTSFV